MFASDGQASDRARSDNEVDRDGLSMEMSGDIML